MQCSRPRKEKFFYIMTEIDVPSISEGSLLEQVKKKMTDSGSPEKLLLK